MLLVRLLGSSGLLVLTFQGSQQVFTGERESLRWQSRKTRSSPPFTGRQKLLFAKKLLLTKGRTYWKRSTGSKEGTTGWGPAGSQCSQDPRGGGSWRSPPPTNTSGHILMWRAVLMENELETARAVVQPRLPARLVTR